MPQNFAELVGAALDMISLVIPLIFTFTLVIIIWKVIDSWVVNAGDPKKIDEGRQYALWGVLVLVIMSSVWAIVRLLRNSVFGI